MRTSNHIKINLKTDNPYALYIKENKEPIDSNLIQSIDETKVKFPGEKFLKLLDSPSAKTELGLIQYGESRRCLLKAIDDLGFKPNNSCELYTSISHTKTHSGALACVGQSPDLLGIGLDIENMSREVSPEVFSKFQLKSEEKYEITPVELWTIKEAAFKSSSSFFKGSLFQYEIKTYNKTLNSGRVGTVDSSDFRIDFEIHSIDNLVITAAFARAET